MGLSGGWRRGRRRFVTIAVWLVVLFVLLRLYLRDTVLEWPGFSYFEQTQVGGAIGAIIDRFAQTVFGSKPPGISTVEIVAAWIGTFVEAASNIKLAQLLAAGTGALMIALLSLSYNLWRNRRIQKMCSAQLYVTAIKLTWNTVALDKAFRREGEVGKEKLVLHVDNEVRASMHRLRSELELIQDFSIAYDYAFWPRLRETTARLRMQSMSLREAIDVVMSEIDRMSEADTNIDVSSERFFAMVVRDTFDGLDLLYIPGGVSSVINQSLLLGEQLERGFFGRWRHGSGDSLPESLARVKAIVKQGLERARKQSKKDQPWWSNLPATWMQAPSSVKTLHASTNVATGHYGRSN